MPETLILDEVETQTVTAQPYNVILFNDETHSTDEVRDQIIKAIHCTPQNAESIMMRAHKTGRAIVFTGGLERCELIKEILEEIQLGVSLEKC